MMKLLVIYAFVIVAVVVKNTLAAPRTAQDPQNVELLRYESKNDGLGTYSFSYEQSDGSSRIEEGELKDAGAEDEHISVKGSYSWIGPDGVNYTVTYIADENGYQPSTNEVPPFLSSVPSAVVASLLG